MSERTTPGDRRASRDGSDPGASGTAPSPASSTDPLDLEPSARERFDALSQPIRERFEEPITKVSTLTQKTMALFPVRVWRHFLARNGFILSAGMSYQALFAIFAAVYVVFAVAGIWLTGNEQALNAFIALLNSFAPGLVGDDGIISTDDLIAIATTSTSLFGWTGAVALVGLIWTAIGWITYSRIAVRSIFGLPKDTRAYALLKTRDFLVGLAFGTILILATILTVATTSFFGWLTTLLGLAEESVWSNLVRAGRVGPRGLRDRHARARDAVPVPVGGRDAVAAHVDRITPRIGGALGAAAPRRTRDHRRRQQPAAGDLRGLHRAAALVPAHRHRHPRRGELDRRGGVRRAREPAAGHARAARRGGARPRAAMRS